MNYVWDIVLVIVLIYCIMSAAKKGFIGACKNIVSIVLTLILLSTMHPLILGHLQTSEIGNGIRQIVSENIAKTYEKEQIPEETDTSDTETTMQICQSLALPSFLSEKIEKSLSEMSAIRNNVMDVITDTIALLVLKVLAMIILYIIVKLFVFLALKILESLFKLPLLRTVNTGLGALVGVINALLIIYIVCGALNLFVPTANHEQVHEVINTTYLLKYFYNNNILLSLIM